MSVLLKVLAVCWMIFTGWAALNIVISMGQMPFVWFDILPREMTENEMFILSAVILLFVSCLALAFGGAYMDKVLGAREPSPREQDVLNQAIERLTEAYKARYSRSMPSLTWRVLDDNSYNAMAYARGSIAVSRALIGLARDNGIQGIDGLVGVAAHELGHIEHRDTLFSLIMSAVAWPLRLLVVVFVPLSLIFAMMQSFLAPKTIKDTSWAAGFLALVSKLAFYVEVIGWLLLGFSSKPSEYKADKFAAQLVGPSGLMSFFDLIGPLDVNSGSGVLEYYVKSHPPTELRRARIEQFQEI